MLRSVCLRLMNHFGSVLLSSFLIYGALAGCQESNGPKWEIVADNQSDISCDVYVALAGGFHSEARLDNLKPGKSAVVTSGGEKVIVRLVKVVQNGFGEEFKRNVEVPVGKRFLIQISADGNAATSLVEKITSVDDARPTALRNKR